RVGLTGLLAFLLLHLLVRQAAHPPGTTRRVHDRTRSSLAGVLFLFTLYPQSARAEFPPQPLLDELRARVLAPAACEPNCATVQRARVEMSDTGLSLTTEVHVEA